ncbi:MAG TPA: aldo/keto reductase [Epulopiscium sp.]|nr:aldo/keto reductase [Candidatus Epulonipiscium sp.]
MKENYILLPDGTKVPRLGQGTWCMGERKEKEKNEIASLQLGIELGMTLIDTAEMYAEGGAEEVIAQAIRPYDRDSLFIVSKVYPHNAGRKNIFKSCENSLRRLNTDYLDLYLLHWRGSIPLEETAECMEELVHQGKIKYWGVSNFDTDDMEELWSVPSGNHCVTNQVLYHLGSRGIEYDLVPWMKEHHIPIMAYSPLAQAGSLRRGLVNHKTVQEIAQRKEITPMQVLLAFVLSQDHMIAIPKSGTPDHTKLNAEALKISFTQEEWEQLDKAFPAPNHKTKLDIC